jgi:hypothetical protein
MRPARQLNAIMFFRVISRVDMEKFSEVSGFFVTGIISGMLDNSFYTDVADSPRIFHCIKFNILT